VASDALVATDALARDNIALPMSPVLSASQAGEVVSALAALANVADGEPHDRALA
jgi:dTDP-4-amino-4,6-dideoxygalactose transaminase